MKLYITFKKNNKTLKKKKKHSIYAANTTNAERYTDQTRAITCVSPADFDPLRWNSGQQGVLHLNQKLQSGEGRWGELWNIKPEQTDARMCHFWLNMRTDTTDHHCNPNWTINLLPPPAQTETPPPVQKRWCSRMPGHSVSAWFLCDGDGFHWWLPGFVPSSPAALGSQTGLRTTPSYFLTYRDAKTQSQCNL